METKRFTVIDSDTQRTKVIESTAETVAELKRDLISNGFSVEGKTIQEGLTRIEFKSDDAYLPHDVPRNGAITNDLVFRLTKANKNIKSGATSRLEAYSQVKELNLGDYIKAKYGKNFTQCSTDVLITEIEKAKSRNAAKAESEVKEVPSQPTIESKECEDSTKAALVFLVTTLLDNGSIGASDAKSITDILGVTIKDTSNVIYSQSELDSMFSGM